MIETKSNQKVLFPLEWSGLNDNAHKMLTDYKIFYYLSYCTVYQNLRLIYYLMMPQIFSNCWPLFLFHGYTIYNVHMKVNLILRYLYKKFFCLLWRIETSLTENCGNKKKSFRYHKEKDIWVLRERLAIALWKIMIL